jgi:hypothetical protein
MSKIVEILKKHNIPIIDYWKLYGAIIYEKPLVIVNLYGENIGIFIDYEILLPKELFHRPVDDPELQKYYSEFLNINRKLFKTFYDTVIMKSEKWKRVFEWKHKHMGETIRTEIENFLNEKTNYIPFNIGFPSTAGHFISHFGVGHALVKLIGEQALMLNFIPKALEILKAHYVK